MTPVSAQPYYYYALKEIYSDFGLGPEKARLISPIKWLTDRKIPLALHSDFTMAPAKPLFLMWTAVNKVARQYFIDSYFLIHLSSSNCPWTKLSRDHQTFQGPNCPGTKHSWVQTVLGPNCPVFCPLPDRILESKLFLDCRFLPVSCVELLFPLHIVHFLFEGSC